MNADEIMQMQDRLKPGPRPRQNTLVETSVMLGRDERQALDAVADEMGLSRSALIRQAVQRTWLKGKGRKQ